MLPYKVWITSINAKHTCLMSNSTYHGSQKVSKSSKINLFTMKTVMEYLKVDQFMNARNLRNLLKASLPSHKCIDHMFINNFRKKLHFITQNILMEQF